MKRAFLLGIVITAAMLLAACGGGAAPTPPPVVVSTTAPTSLPPTAAPTRVSPTATTAPSPAAVAMGDQAVIQVRYLDMAMNMHDIVHLTAKWQKGNDGARAELGEKLERLEAAMGYKGFPAEMKKGIDGLMMSMNAMSQSAKAKDAKAGMKNLADMEKSWDDIAHPFYGTWMMGMSKGMGMSDEVSLQATQLDLARNLENLDELVTEWGEGDEVARVEAGEVLERMEALMGYVKWPTEATTGVEGLKTSLKPMGDAIKAKDAASGTKAMPAIAKAYDSIAHPFYGAWMMSMLKGMKMSTPLAVQVNFLDAAANASELAELVEKWNDGDEEARGEAGEKAERLETLFDYVTWPSELGKPVAALKTAIQDAEKAIKAKDKTAAAQVAAQVEKTLDDLSHTYYKWVK